MSKVITYVVTHEHGRWVGRCPTGEVAGVAVADSLTRLERELGEAHTWAWPHDTPGVAFTVDLRSALREASEGFPGGYTRR